MHTFIFITHDSFSLLHPVLVTHSDIGVAGGPNMFFTGYLDVEQVEKMLVVGILLLIAQHHFTF